jgi:hypothetical protein
MTTEFASDGDLTLSCQSNTGTDQIAFAESRQLAAIRVGKLTENDLAP